MTRLSNQIGRYEYENTHASQIDLLIHNAKALRREDVSIVAAARIRFSVGFG